MRESWAFSLSLSSLFGSLGEKLTLVSLFPSLVNSHAKLRQWIYFEGYAKKGPKGRVPGAAVSSLVQLISTIVVLIVGVKAAVKLLPL